MTGAASGGVDGDGEGPREGDEVGFAAVLSPSLFSPGETPTMNHASTPDGHEGAGGAGERPGAARHPRDGALPPADGDGFGLPGGGFFAAGDAELGDDFGDVVLGGGEGDVEALGDLFVGEAFAEEVEDLPFAGGEDVGMGRAAAPRRGSFGGHGEISVRLVWGNYTSRFGS